MHYLCKVYTDPTPPLSFVDRLLTDMNVTSHVQLTREMVIKKESGQVEEDEEKPEESGVETVRLGSALKRPGDKAARWIAETSHNVQLLVTRVGKPEKWDGEVNLTSQQASFDEFSLENTVSVLS